MLSVLPQVAHDKQPHKYGGVSHLVDAASGNVVFRMFFLLSLNDFLQVRPGRVQQLTMQNAQHSCSLTNTLSS